MKESESKVTPSGDGAGMRILRISALLAGIYVFFHLLPDFAPERPETFLRKAVGDLSPEMCEAEGIGFIQVNQNRSALIMHLLAHSSPKAGEPVRVTVALERSGGRPVRFDELEVNHTEKFHLLVVDPALGDYHHVHPVPTDIPGEYEFTFTPERGGVYRMFGEVVPTITGRPAQGVADLEVEGEVGRLESTPSRETRVGDYQFRLVSSVEQTRAKQPEILRFEMRHVVDGEPVELEPVMGAWAHIVAFDPERSGFAHMHPLQEGVEKRLDEFAPEVDFMFYAEKAGTYTVWAQVKIEGEEVFAPFVLEAL